VRTTLALSFTGGDFWLLGIGLVEICPPERVRVSEKPKWTVATAICDRVREDPTMTSVSQDTTRPLGAPEWRIEATNAA